METDTEKGRDIVIGDVHGCADELSDLLRELRVRREDRFYFLGDLVNRGPDTPGVFTIMRSLPNARCLMGNHELRLLKYRHSGDTRHLKSSDWDTLPRLTDEDWLTIRHMEHFIYLESMLTVLVHGGFMPDVPWFKQPLSVTTHVQVIHPNGTPGKRADYEMGTPWGDLWEGPPFVIYGHTPKRQIQRRRWTLGIDTGCVMGGSLTACILPERQIVQVPARATYHDKPLT